ncbi:MAG TPA: TIGR02996 domain-containing protein [Gemmataceae bacterium]|nr:TIGR02996 domain-containing protein [Gemmataceae bacterium]
MPRSKDPSPRSEQEAFLADVIEHPDDDAPRLVYADWLDDHGDADRAEFIRLQCEVAKLEQWDARRPELLRRQKGLLRLHARQWGEGVVKNLYGAEFRRGFVEIADLPPKVFLANADDLFRRFPLRRLKLGSSFGDPAVRALAASPHLARFTELEIPYSRMTAAGLEALVSSPHVRGLKVLEIDFNGIGPQGARAVAESPHLAGLTALTLRSCEIGSAGAEAVAGSPHLAGLEKLDLMVNQIDDAGARALAASPHLVYLAELSLWNNRVGPAGARALVSVRRPRLMRLYLSCNPLGYEGALALAQSPTSAA